MNKLPTANDRQSVRVLKALADPKRFQMFKAIAAAGELSCTQIGMRFRLAQPTISHHLKVLHDASLLEVREEGQMHFISVNREVVRSVLGTLPKRLIRRRAVRTKPVRSVPLPKGRTQRKRK
jgi:ArsR family transcriptional regulator, arsenate/arsenite/antimonite-responsive transcriptional repressor